MRPTPEENLAGADRLLVAVLGEPDLPAAAAEAVADARRLLEQTRRMVMEGPAFLAGDNERLRVLLADLIRELPTTDLPARTRIHAYLTERTDRDPR